MTKILIVSDVHLKLRQHAAFEQSRFEQLIRLLQNSDAGIIIFNGDLLDIARPTLEELKVLTEGLNKLHHKKVYIISGNHEAVTKDSCTYNYWQAPQALWKSKHEVLEIEGVTIRLTDWKDIHSLHEQLPADILITHYRSAVTGLFEEEVATSKFINYYKLIILGDIHYRYSPADNVFYTGCPYPTHYIKDSREYYGCIELTLEDSSYTWKYINFDLPKKVRLDISYKDLEELKLNTQWLYKIHISGTLDEINELPSISNVSFTKEITDSSNITQQEPQVVVLDFIDTLSIKVNEQLTMKVPNTKQILLKLQGD